MKKGYDWLGFYHDADDLRLVVPKSMPIMGWTINVSHRHGKLVLCGVALFVLAAAALSWFRR